MRTGGKPFLLVAPEPAEHELQLACTKLLESSILLDDVQWTAIDHAHSLDQRPSRVKGKDGKPISIGLLEAWKRKRRGIKKGVWDYVFWARGTSFVLELKVGDNDLDDDQKDFGRGLIRAGIEIKVAWNIDQFFATICAWDLVRPGVRIAA